MRLIGPYLRLPRDLRRDLRTALSGAVLDLAAITRIAEEADVPVAHLAQENTASDRWHQVLRSCPTRRVLGAVIVASCEEYRIDGLVHAGSRCLHSMHASVTIDQWRAWLMTDCRRASEVVATDMPDSGHLLQIGGVPWRLVAAVASTLALAVIVYLAWPRAASGSPYRLGSHCTRQSADVVACKLEIEDHGPPPGVTDRRRQRIVIGITPSDGFEIAEHKKCPETDAARGNLIVDECLEDGLLDEQKLDLTILRTMRPDDEPLHLTVMLDATMIRDKPYTLMGHGNYDIADRIFKDRALSGSTPKEKAMATYYLAYTNYLRGTDCALRGSLIDRECPDDALGRFYRHAVAILDVPLTQLLNNTPVPDASVQSARLHNELELRFGRSSLGTVAGRLRNFLKDYPCSDFQQQARFFLALIHRQVGEPDAVAPLLEQIIAAAEQDPSPECLVGKDATTYRGSMEHIIINEADECGLDTVKLPARELVCEAYHHWAVPSLVLDEECAADAPGRMKPLLSFLDELMAARDGKGWTGRCLPEPG